MIKYHKIETVFERDMEGTKKLIEGAYRDPLVEFLKDVTWRFTEKIDGTNIGIYWDGHKVHFQGRTEKANIPAFLLDRLIELFGGDTNEELFEQMFGEKEVVLFGEGFGNRIQKCGSAYIPDGVDFILFDVYIPERDLYLEYHNVVDIAKAFGIEWVPVAFMGTIEDAVEYVKNRPDSFLGNAKMEGVVGTPLIDVRDRTGKRVIVKIKVNDFEVSDNE